MPRNRIIHLPALCLVMLLAACATAPREAADARRTVVSIPLDIGRLKIGRSYEYPDPRLGTVYAYAGDFALTPDVYIYPNPFLEGHPTAGIRQRTLEREVERFRKEIEYAVRRGHYDDADFLGTTDVHYDWKYGTAVGKRVALTIEKDGNPVLSHAYIFPVADMFLKIRISHYEYFGLADNMDWFAGELMGGTRVAFYDADGRPVLDVDANLTRVEELLSRMDDVQVVETRAASIERAIVETRDRIVYYGEFDTKEPVLGPMEAGDVEVEISGTRVGRPL